MHYTSQHIPTLRICGLSDPIHASNKAEKVLGQQFNHIGNLVAKFNTKAFEIIGGYKGIHLDTFSDSIILLPSDFEYGNGISSDGRNFFHNSWNGYSFGHFFLGKYENNFSSVLSCIEIDIKAIQETQEIIGEVEFRKFEKALGLLMSIMNHDATTHKFGVIAGGDRMGKLNRFLSDNLGFEKDIPTTPSSKNLKFNPGEVAAAAFHRDMFEEIDELGIPLKKIIIHNSEVLLNYILQISDPNLRGYWITVLKYPLFSLLNPEGEEIKNLRERFPTIKLTTTPWGKLVHRKINKCSITHKSGEIIEITLRDIRKLMMNFYHTQNNNIDTQLAQLIAVNGDYPPPEDWQHLENMMIARKLGLPYDVSREILEIYEEYTSFKKSYREVKGFIYPFREYGQYKFFKDKGLDVSEWDNQELWREAFKKYILYRIDCYLSNRISFDTGFEISEYIREAQELGFDIQEIEFIDFVKSRVNRLQVILEMIENEGWGKSLPSALDISEEFEHVKGLGVIDESILCLYVSLDITSHIDPSERIPF